MRVIVDSREQAPFPFRGPRYEGVTVEVGTLSVGDYSLAGLADKVAVERKELGRSGRRAVSQQAEPACGLSKRAGLRRTVPPALLLCREPGCGGVHGLGLPAAIPGRGPETLGRHREGP